MNIFSLLCGQLDDSCFCLIPHFNMIQVYPVVMKNYLWFGFWWLQSCESKQEFKWELCGIQTLVFIGHFEVHRTGSYKWRWWGNFRFSI